MSPAARGVQVPLVTLQTPHPSHSVEQQKPSEPETQLPVWDETMTDEQILDLLPRIAAVGAQTEGSLQRLVAILREADKDEVFRVHHQAVGWRAAAENARRALSELSRRPTNWREQRLRGLR